MPGLDSSPWNRCAQLPEGLKALSLYNNSLSGPLPAGLKLPNSLITLDFAANMLEGTIPAELALPDSLIELWLDNNKLSGPLPGALKLPASLQLLSVHHNELSGELPSDLVLNVALKQISLHNNAFTGPLPNWRYPANFTGLFLQNNQISGPIPADWSLPDTVQFLQVRWRRPVLCSYCCCAALGMHHMLWLVQQPGKVAAHPGCLSRPGACPQLANNSLSGTFPPTWDFPLSLKELSLDNNKLSGENSAPQRLHPAKYFA